MQKRNNALIFSIAMRINSNQEIVNQEIDELDIIHIKGLLAAKAKARDGITRQRAHK
ncbi:unknown protein [Cronobacter turicensis z3032]|uniref:Uncharacterized protein n=1 Tax=Cronobacter turicensis (strain DSM 18703 / CCUG 55852 / LMG 23827 / z3032) TaxID=693216 RepID=C9XZN1_CROTZ|nr:unknown protein [Cronobacter turicensis z3032]